MPIELSTAIFLFIAFACAAWLVRSPRPAVRPVLIDAVVLPVEPAAREHIDMFV